MASSQQMVFVVDDDPSVREGLTSLFRSTGLRAEAFASAEEFLRHARPAIPACLVLDVRMPGMSGLDLQRQLVEQRDAIPIIFVTGHGDIPTTVRAMKAGAVEFLSKPFRDDNILEAVRTALARVLLARQARKKVRALHATERNEAAALLQAANEKVALILDSIGDNFFALGSDWRYTYLNKHAAAQMRALGKDPAKLIGKLLWAEFQYVPNEVTIHRVMAERVALTDELFYPPLGEWVENRIYPSDDGGIVIFQRYITDRKRAEEKLRRSEANLAEGQRISHTGSWAWNASSGVLFWSVEHFRIFGLDPQKTEASTTLGFGMVHPQDRVSIEDTFQSAVRSKGDFEVEFRIIRTDGVVRYLRSVGHPVLDETGALVEFVGTVADLTERKRAEEGLRIAQTELARVSRAMMMGELTASIAHEVNQPLSGVIANGIACLRWLDRDVPDLEEARAAVRRIVQDGNRASEVIARIRALIGKTDTEKGVLNISDIIGEAIALVRHELSIHGVALRTMIDDDLPPVQGDRIQLQQVLLNLIMNGIEAISAVSGGGTSEMLIMAQSIHDGHVRVAVRDSGIGIDPSREEQMFEAFYTTKLRGMGIGLSISRSIVEAHEGSLRAARNEGPGSTFTFTLPIHAPPVA